MVSNARRLETSQVRAVTGEDRQEKAKSPETLFMESFCSYFTCVEEASGLKVRKFEVNKMKNHDGSPSLTLIYAFSSYVLMSCAKAYTVSCPAGLNYNPSIEKCDWPENAPCASSQENGRTNPYRVDVVK